MSIPEKVFWILNRESPTAFGNQGRAKQLVKGNIPNFMVGEFERARRIHARIAYYYHVLSTVDGKNPAPVAS